MSERNNSGELSNESSAQSPIPVIYESMESSLPKDDIISMLDKMENHVEIIRKRAFEIEEERDAMFTTLHAFKHSRIMEDLSDRDRADIDRCVDRIYSRCSTIEVTVRTIRDQPQEEALYKINGIIDKLITDLREDPGASRDRCLAFMNSCTSYHDTGVEDVIFEQALLGCTVDDQKRVRRRLRGLMNYIEKLS